MSTVHKVRKLLAPIMTDEDSYLRLRVGDDPQLSPAELLQAVVFDSSFDRGSHINTHPSPPGTVEELAETLFQISVTTEQMTSFLVYICTTDIAFGMERGPWKPETARLVLEGVVKDLQPGVRWWSNTEYPSWAWEQHDFLTEFSSSPVTGHTLDCALVGIGHEVTLTLLAYGDT